MADTESRGAGKVDREYRTRVYVWQRMKPKELAKKKENTGHSYTYGRD